MRILLAAVAGAVLLYGCAGARLKAGAAKDGEVVEAEGWAPVVDDDVLGMKQRSLAEAQKKAVERVVGVFVSARTRVAQSVTVDQNILANVGGYIRKYDVLSERVEDGFYKTRIRALVLHKKVGSDLKSLGLTRPEPPPGNPRVAVLLSGEGSGGQDGAGAAAAVRQAFVERGFQVLDLDGARKADLVVRGKAESRELFEVDLGGFHSFRARVELSVLKTGTREVVSQVSREGVGMDPVPRIAESKSLEDAGRAAGNALAAGLAGEPGGLEEGLSLR